jgi:hypothetical protein
MLLLAGAAATLTAPATKESSNNEAERAESNKTTDYTTRNRTGRDSRATSSGVSRVSSDGRAGAVNVGLRDGAEGARNRETSVRSSKSRSRSGNDRGRSS